MTGFLDREIGKRRNFYQDNIGNYVNLFKDSGRIISGVISDYNPCTREIIFGKSIQRVYGRNGESKFVSSEILFLVPSSSIADKSKSNELDFLGRIEQYNKDLKEQLLKQEQLLEQNQSKQNS